MSDRSVIRELAEAYVNVDFELDFDLKDRADQLADTFLGKVMVGASGRDIIYKTLREGAVLSKEWELMRGAQEIRGAIWFGPDAERGEKPIHSEAPIPTESGKYEAWGTQGQGGVPIPMKHSSHWEMLWHSSGRTRTSPRKLPSAVSAEPPRQAAA